MKIRHKKVVYEGIEFDSLTERDYYIHLKQQSNIVDIELQPKYELVKAFTVECNKCRGVGKIPSPKTDRMIKCRTCEGDGWKKRQAWTYKADFLVTYNDGYQEVIDVKGHANERFPLVKKMWEKKFGKELIVVKKIKGRWIRK